jgi:hypothetical protein
MSDWLEHLGLRVVSTAIALVFWPLQLLAKLADALSYIDPKLEGI